MSNSGRAGLICTAWVPADMQHIRHSERTKKGRGGGWTVAEFVKAGTPRCRLL